MVVSVFDASRWRDEEVQAHALCMQMAAEEAAAAAEAMIGPPPPDMVAEADMVAGDARAAEVVRIMQ